MAAFSSTSDFNSDLQQRARAYGMPILALRRRSADHPMAMFALATGVALMSMAFASASSTAFASMGEPLRINDDIRTTSKQDRLPVNEKDVACRGQAWGAESDECLKVIARDSGRSGEFKVRKLASAETLAVAPNIF